MITAILATFDEYEVVAIPEGEGWQDQGGFVLTLIRTPGFPDKVNGIEVEYSNSLYQPSWTVIFPRTTCSGRAFVVFNRLPSEAPTSTGILISSTAPRTELQPDQVSDIEGVEGRAFFSIHLRYSLSLETPQQSGPVATEHVLHMQKTLDQMNLQIHRVLSDITGLSGLRILDAILAGKRDP